MMRYICDGCGGSAPRDQDRTIAIDGRGSLLIRPIGFHLCDACLPKAIELVAKKFRGDVASANPPYNSPPGPPAAA
jgi:hypothetical protein